MKIGITFLPLGSAFSGGGAQVAVHLGELFVLLGHEVTLISLAAGRIWFDDCVAMPSLAGFKLIDGSRQVGSDDRVELVIDTFGSMTGESRRRFGDRCVVFSRGPAVLSDQEGSVYGANTLITNYDGVSAIWTWDHWDDGEIQYLETMSRLPVVRLPFVWFPTLLEIYRREAEGSLNALKGGHVGDGGLHCHIMETNTKVTSSCNVPLMICQRALVAGLARLTEVDVHCSEHIVDGKYFSENFKKHLDPGLVERLRWVGRERVVDLLKGGGSGTFVLSHLRFRGLRNLLLDCVWLGIPVVHNSQWLRDFGWGYEKLYYSGNSVSEGAEAVRQVGCVGSALAERRSEVSEALGPLQRDLCERREALLKKVSTLDEKGVSLYSDALAGGVCLPPVAESAGCRQLVVQFTDFWSGFQASYNFFILLLQEALRSGSVQACSGGEDMEVVGVGEEYLGHPDLLIFGPYSEKWRQVPAEVPKVHYTAEWSGVREGPGVFLNLGFEKRSESEAGYIRLPLWVLSINWFGADNARLVNPTLMDLEDLVGVGGGDSDAKRREWTSRERFCAFVVSNPRCSERNDAFTALNSWRHVDSGGTLFNNIGNGLVAGPGGGGGERAKVEFYRKYKYVLCYENQRAEGYTTEKLLHAKAAGCVPIYWGDGDDFDSAGFINMTDRRPEEVIETISYLEESASSAAEKMAALPALNSEKLQWCRELLSRVSGVILERILGNGVAARVPRELGCTVSSIGSVAPLEGLIIATSASRETAGNLYLWLSFIKKIYQGLPEATVIVRWSSSDTPPEQLIYLFPFIKIIQEKISLYLDICGAVEEGRCVLYMPPNVILARIPVNFLVTGVGSDGITCVDGTEIACFRSAKDMASLLRGRRIVSREGILGTVSLEKTHREGASFYMWDQQCGFKLKEEFISGIDNAYIISLKRRADRLAKFRESHWEQGQVEVFEAFDGRNLRLGPNLVRLFYGNTFGWKKGVIGCNLSHLAIWNRLAHSNQFTNSLLVLEDDVKFSEGWKDMLTSAMKCAPADYDILYLGGLLPPNKDGWYSTKESVNSWWCRIGLNQHFGQVESTRFYHFCTYAYVLSKSGAKKLLATIERECGFKKVVDHQILHSWSDLNIYVSDPILAGCYQDSDPAYKQSNFNDLGRADTFDSDIWTSRDCFELDGAAAIAVELDVGAALTEAAALAVAGPEAAALAVAGPEAAALAAAVPAEKRIVCFSSDLVNVFERKWLEDIFCRDFGHVEMLEVGCDPIQNAIVLYQGRDQQQVVALSEFLARLEARGWSCGIIHLSDEFMIDDISFYERQGVRWVVRNYWRGGLDGSKVTVIPLGYHRKSAAASRKPLIERQLAWSFHGTAWTRWPGRTDMLRVLEGVLPHTSYVRGAWEEPMSDESAMLADMEDSWIVPCPEGNNTESFRIYEALEAGAFPVLVDEGRGNDSGSSPSCSKHFYLWLQAALPSICILRSWEDALKIFRQAKEEPAAFEARRDRLVGEWDTWKVALRDSVRNKV